MRLRATMDCQQECHVLQEELQDLQAEIAALEARLEQQDSAAESLDTERIDNCIAVLDKLPIGADGDGKSIEMLESQLNLLRNVTGITLQDTTCTVLNEGEERKQMQHTLKGSTYDIEFALQFVAEESKESADDPATIKIQKMEIVIEEEVPENIIKVLAKAEETCSVQDFFRIMVPYAKWHQSRERMFKHFAKKHKKIVHLPEEQPDMMQIYAPGQNSIVWTVHWGFVLSSTNSVLPLVQLYVQAPSTVAQKDSGGLLESAPAKFQQMLNAYGIEKAVNTIIQIVHK